MNNIKVKEIIKFSFYKNLQNKWFLIFNIISLVSILLITNIESISKLYISEPKEEIFTLAVLDPSNLVYDDFVNIFYNNPSFSVERVNEDTYTADNIPDNFAVINILPDDVEAFKTIISSKEGIKTNIYEEITKALHHSRNRLLSIKYNISDEEFSVLQSDLTIERKMLAVQSENSNAKELIKLFSSTFTYFITVILFSKMANDIAQEKQSKSSEYVLTTVSAKEYLFAKIFSSIAILIIQGLLLLVYYLIGVGVMSITSIASTDIKLSLGNIASDVSLDIVLYIFALLVYNILNLILLSIVQATLAAKTSSVAEAGNTVSLLVVLMMIAYFATIYVIKPYSKINILLYVLSCLPILSAYLVPAIIVIGQGTILQVIFSLATLLIAIPVTFRLCSVSFKNGILDYTKMKKATAKDDKKNINNLLIKRKMKNIGFVIGTSLVIYIGLQTVIPLLTSYTLPVLLGNILTTTDISLIQQFLIQVISLGLSCAFIFAYCKKSKSHKTSLENITTNKITIKKKLGILLISFFLIFTLQILLEKVVYSNIGIDYNITNIFETNSESNLLSKAILILTLAVTPAIFEELFFRKAIIDFTSPYGKNFALLFSSILFGLIHMNMSQGLFAFIVGFIFGVIYLYTNDIKLTMLIHFINNGISALLMIFPEHLIVIANLVILGLIFIGFIYFIKLLVKKSTREQIFNFLSPKISLSVIKNKYIYILYDYIFDVSMILVFVMSILTERLLRTTVL